MRLICVFTICHSSSSFSDTSTGSKMICWNFSKSTIRSLNVPKFRIENMVYCVIHITTTRLYKFDPLKPHFYIVKLGFTGVYIILFILLKNIDFGYSLEPPRRGSSNEYPKSMFWAEIWKISEFLSENFPFLVVKFSIYLNRRVFVMKCSLFKESWYTFRGGNSIRIVLSPFWKVIYFKRKVPSGHTMLKQNWFNVFTLNPCYFNIVCLLGIYYPWERLLSEGTLCQGDQTGSRKNCLLEKNVRTSTKCIKSP